MSAPTSEIHVSTVRALARMLALAVNIVTEAPGKGGADEPKAETVTASGGTDSRMEPVA